MAGKTLSFACSCGELTGRLVDVNASTGTHITCHCDDCRANLTALGQTDPSDAGVDIFQTTPDHVRIDTGGENLHILRLSPDGLLRWYASCCSTPLFNTMKSGKVPFVGVLSDRLSEKDALGPIAAKAYVPGKGGKTYHEGAMGVVGGVMIRAAKSRLSGRHKDTPFFDAEGAPTAGERVLTRQERAAALMRG